MPLTKTTYAFNFHNKRYNNSTNFSFPGRTCTHTLLFAQLITPDGTNHGLHGFLVPIRNPETLETYPGLIVGDMGEKIGVNGIDNG